MSETKALQIFQYMSEVGVGYASEKKCLQWLQNAHGAIKAFTRNI